MDAKAADIIQNEIEEMMPQVDKNQEADEGGLKHNKESNISTELIQGKKEEEDKSQNEKNKVLTTSYRGQVYHKDHIVKSN